MSAIRRPKYLIDAHPTVLHGWRIDTLYDMRQHTRVYGQFVLERVLEDGNTIPAIEQAYFKLIPHEYMPSGNVNAIVDGLRKFINDRINELGCPNLRVARIIFPLDCPAPLNREAGVVHGIIY